MADNKSTFHIIGDTSSGIAALKNLSNQFGKSERDIKGFGSSVSGTLGSLTSLIASPTFMISSAVIGFSSMVKSSINAADNLYKLSQKVGMTVEDLSTLSYAAKLSGIEIEGFETGIKKLNVNMMDAANGTGDAKDAFANLGISLKNENGRLNDSSEMLKKISDKFASMPDGVKKTALAVDIFGKAGADLIPFLNMGTEGLAAMQEEARKLNQEISTEAAKSAEQFNDNLERLSKTLQGLSNLVMPAFTEALNSWLELFQNPSWDNFLRTLPWVTEEATDLNDILKKGGESMKTFGDYTETTADKGKNLVDVWGKVEDGLRNDIVKNNLSNVGYEFYKIDEKVKELQEKLGNKNIIDEWAASAKKAVTIEGIENKDPNLMMNIDVSGPLKPMAFDTSFYDAQKKQISEVTDWELANHVLRQQSTTAMFSNMADAAYMFYQASGEQNKLAFGMYKAFAIAETSISTYQAAVDAYKSMVGIPVVGPTLAVAAAAAATAFGLARINQIASMSPGGRATGGSSASSVSVPSSTTNNQSNQTYLTFNIQSNWQNPDELLRNHLLPAINRYVKDGGKIIIK